MGKVRDLKGEFVPVAVTAILDGCRACGQPVPVNGLVDKTSCPHCQASVTVPSRLWERAIGALDVGALVDETGQRALRARPEFKDGTTRRTLRVERTIRDSPLCIHCGAELEVLEESALEATFDLRCASCGASSRFEPPGLQLRLPSVGLSHVSATEGGAEATDATSATATAAGRTEPVVMSCPSCSASLDITADSERTTRCQYCNASVYIPDDLWRRMHPVRTATTWNVVYRLTPEALRTGGLRSVGCVVGAVAIAGGGMFLGLGGGMVAAAREGHYVAAAIAGLLLAGLGGGAIAVIGASLRSALGYRRLASRLESAAKSR